ncbi:MAG TPA: ATP-grasp domain-containing protein [Isosphaeraceae bacterium]|nr:ATP-grasp domain-containing protein [Isosphaeraceae bacterium]
MGIAFSQAPNDRTDIEGPDDQFEEFDRPETIEALADVLRGEGHDVVLLGDGRELLETVLRQPPDFVVNIAEGSGTSRNREARVPAVLEMLGIPYWGSDAFTMSATLDKDLAKRLVLVDVPRGVLLPADLEDEAEVRMRLSVGFGDSLSAPVILKPSLEGSSKGIRGRCVADTIDEALEHYRMLALEYRQAILVEEFILGDEVTVGLVGDGIEAEVLGLMRILPTSGESRFVYSLEVKRDWQRRVTYETPARLHPRTADRVAMAAKQAYTALGCRDFARIDFRVRDGVPYFLEANPLPGLSPETSDLVILARGYGIDHPSLIRKILNASMRRQGLAT